MSNDKRWQDMTADEQAVAIRQMSGAVNGLQFRVQHLEDAVKAYRRGWTSAGTEAVLGAASPSLHASEHQLVEVPVEAQRLRKATLKSVLAKATPGLRFNEH